MKSFTQKPKQRSQAAANLNSGRNAEAGTGREADRIQALDRQANQGPHAARTADVQLKADQSPRVIAQRKRIGNILSGAVQRQSPLAEEELQMKASPVQRQDLDEEELLQGRFEVAQRQGDLMDEEELLQGKFSTVQRQGPFEEEDFLQGRFAASSAVAQLEGDANPTSATLAGVESLSGMDMSDVKVHHDSPKPSQINALAYAQGNDIHLGPGQEEHLPHEAWHVVQQRQGRVKPTLQVRGMDVNDDAGLEKEADVMGRRATTL